MGESSQSRPEYEHDIVLYHVPQTRSVRPLILYYELALLYGEENIPRLRVHRIEQSQFRGPDRPSEIGELNPNAKVPIMVHGDIVLFEGCAICLYLLELIDKKHLLAPDNAQFRAQLYLFSVYTPGTLDNLTALSSPIQKIYPADNPRPLTDPNIIALNKQAWLAIAGPYLAKVLGDKEYFFGHQFTAIDAILGYFLIGLQFKRCDWMKQFPSLNAYVNKLKSRASIRKAFDLQPETAQ